MKLYKNFDFVRYINSNQNVKLKKTSKVSSIKICKVQSGSSKQLISGVIEIIEFLLIDLKDTKIK